MKGRLTLTGSSDRIGAAQAAPSFNGKGWMMSQAKFDMLILQAQLTRAVEWFGGKTTITKADLAVLQRAIDALPTEKFATRD